MTRAQLDKEPREVSAMFDAVAQRYDLLNDVLSLGRDRWWRHAVAKAVAAQPGDHVLDLAAGTGTSSLVFAEAGARVAACDFSLGMLGVGARKHRAHPGALRFVAGDALRLPFRDGSFDAVTISFGLRNVADPDAALTEMLRVTRPGGRLVVCEFSHLPSSPLDAWYGRYLGAVAPLVGRLSPAGDAYAYLAESIRAWPPAPELADRISAAGWSPPRWRRLTFGVVALHVALRPRDAERRGDAP